MAQVMVTIIGLQKIGVSLGLALKALGQKKEVPNQFTIIGSDKDAEAIKTATEMGAIDQGERNIASAISKADLVITAMPFNMTQDIFEGIGPELRPGAVVMDLSPLKLPPIAWAKKYFRRDKSNAPEVYLVGVTPIINALYMGDHRQGAEAAKADLFTNGLMMLCPAADCPGEAVQLVSDLSALLGVKVQFVDPAEHDGYIAGMEGLPLLTHLALFRSLHKSPSWDDMRWFGNSSFFLSTHLLSDGNPEHAGAVVHENRQNLVHRVDALIEALQEVRSLLNSTDPMVLAEAFDDPMRRYLTWQIAREKNDLKPAIPDAEPLPTSTSMIAKIFTPMRARSKPKNEK